MERGAIYGIWSSGSKAESTDPAINAMNSPGTLLLNSITRILSWCPRPLQWQLARLIAQIGLFCGFRSAATTRINLRHSFPDLQEAALRKMTKASLTQTAMLLL